MLLNVHYFSKQCFARFYSLAFTRRIPLPKLHPTFSFQPAHNRACLLTSLQLKLVLELWPLFGSGRLVAVLNDESRSTATTVADTSTSDLSVVVLKNVD